MAAAHVVMEVSDVDNREIFFLVGKDMVETVVAHDVMGRLMIQCSLQAGLSHVLRELISFEGCEIYGGAPTIQHAWKHQPKLHCHLGCWLGWLFCPSVSKSAFASSAIGLVGSFGSWMLCC